MWRRKGANLSLSTPQSLNEPRALALSPTVYIKDSHVVK